MIWCYIKYLIEIANLIDLQIESELIAKAVGSSTITEGVHIWLETTRISVPKMTAKQLHKLEAHSNRYSAFSHGYYAP